MAVVSPMAEGLTRNNDLVPGINEGLAVISLDRAVGSHHGGRVIVRKVYVEAEITQHNVAEIYPAAVTTSSLVRAL